MAQFFSLSSLNPFPSGKASHALAKGTHSQANNALAAAQAAAAAMNPAPPKARDAFKKGTTRPMQTPNPNPNSNSTLTPTASTPNPDPNSTPTPTATTLATKPLTPSGSGLLRALLSLGIGLILIAATRWYVSKEGVPPFFSEENTAAGYPECEFGSINWSLGICYGKQTAVVLAALGGVGLVAYAIALLASPKKDEDDAHQNGTTL
jgi:hypothetical protein